MPLFGKKKNQEEEVARSSGSAGRFDEEGKELVGSITVRICSRKTGLEEFREVQFVRVISKRYNLLIMKDYMPIIGELEGEIFFNDGKQEIKREHLNGYFMHKQNVFSLLLKEDRDN